MDTFNIIAVWQTNNDVFGGGKYFCSSGFSHVTGPEHTYTAWVERAHLYTCPIAGLWCYTRVKLDKCLWCY